MIYRIVAKRGHSSGSCKSCQIFVWTEPPLIHLNPHSGPFDAWDDEPRQIISQKDANSRKSKADNSLENRYLIRQTI